MSYSRSLADRVRQALTRTRGIAEKKLFGGLGFLLHGNLLVAVWQQSLIVRLGPEQSPAALEREHVREFDVTGKSMKGWAMVDLDGLESDAQLVEWIEKATAFCETLPAK